LALERAKERCAALPNVIIGKASIAADRIDGPFDLILLSEVAYYWDSGDIGRAASYFSEVIEDGGSLLLVHWTGDTDYPKSADEAVKELKRATEEAFKEILSQRYSNYRLDLWQRQKA